MRKGNFESLILNFEFFLAGLAVLVLSNVPAPVLAGEFSLGTRFQGWSTNYLPPANVSGWEIWAPLSLNFNLDSGIKLYAQGEFGNGGYDLTDDQGNGGTTYLAALSDTVVGGQLSFKSFSVPSLLNIGVNLPTGDQTWEFKQVPANIPTEFIDSRYRGRGFGVNAMYGLAFPAGSGEFGAAAGYQYGGTFNPDTGIPGEGADQLQLGDALFVALNHVQPFAGNQTEVIRLSAFVFLPTEFNSVKVLESGPNLNASYSWTNPSAFSFDAGAQVYLPAQRQDNSGNFTTEPNDSYGPRFYLDPSYAFGDFTLAGRLKYVLSNGYSAGNSLASASVGGFLFGIEPSLRLKLDSGSALRLNAGFDYIIAQGAAVDAGGNPANVIFNNWTFGTSYEVKL